jgi:hypothetical protein
MRQIKIDNELKIKAENFCATLFQRPGVTMQQVIPRLEKLRDDLRPSKHSNYRRYIQLFIDNYDAILRATPSEMINWINQFEAILPQSSLKVNILSKKKKFHEMLVDALRYSDLQGWEFPNYLKITHSKTCVYCNSQLTIVVQIEYFDTKKKKKIKDIHPRFEIDHHYPKSIYPYLATSFYNLYPCCGNCNRVKLDKKAIFQLYTESDSLDIFRFWIDDSDVLKYFASGKKADIKIWFESLNGDFQLLENHNKLFMVQAIADGQIDIAEELLLKSKLYSPAYKKNLVDSLGAIFPDTTIIDRLIIGNYSAPEDTHRRPMSKLTQDIARQLNLIK